MAPPINEAKGVNSVVISGQSAPILKIDISLLALIREFIYSISRMCQGELYDASNGLGKADEHGRYARQGQ
jgi:hypothetical protein